VHISVARWRDGDGENRKTGKEKYNRERTTHTEIKIYISL